MRESEQLLWPFTLSISFGFQFPPLLMFKTDQLDLRGLDPRKSDVKGSLCSLKFQRANAAYHICKMQV